MPQVPKNLMMGTQRCRGQAEGTKREGIDPNSKKF